MRLHTSIALIAALVAVAGCGGGSTTGPVPTDTSDLALVQGKLATRDGSTQTLDGVVVTCLQTGESVTTGHDGAFRMHVPLDQDIHLAFDDPRWASGGPHHQGTNDHRDPIQDGTDIDGDGVRLSPFPHDWCEVEVHLEDGAILECHVRWGTDERAPREGEHHLARDPFCGELDAVGEVEFRTEDGCLYVEVEIGGFSSAASLDIHLVDPTGEEAYLATMDVDATGVGHLEWSWCEGDPLPFDATTPVDLVGYGVVVYDEVGDVVFRGHLPHHHDDAIDHHHCGWEGDVSGPHHGWVDEDDDHHHGGPGGGPGPCCSGGGPRQGQ